MIQRHDPLDPIILPPLGDNPSTLAQGTSPGSFANRPAVGTPYAFSSPDTPGMPPPSDKTAWDFMPADWRRKPQAEVERNLGLNARALAGDRGLTMQTQLQAPAWYEHPQAWEPPAGFRPITQLESARLGVITAQMLRVAQREPHLTPEQVRAEVASGRMVIPANIHHLQYKLDPMAIGRASKTKVNANMGASPVSSSTEEEVEKLKWAERWGADTVMDLSTGGDLDRTRQAIIENSTTPIGTVPIYSMIIGKKIEDLSREIILAELEHQAQQGVDYFTIQRRRAAHEHLPFVPQAADRHRLARGLAAGQVDAGSPQAEPHVRNVG